MFYKSPIQGWRQYPQRYSLQGVVCKSCKQSYFPSKYLCVCGSTDFQRTNFSKNGKLVSFTNISCPATEFKELPEYLIGLIKLDNGPVIIGQITDIKAADIKIGMPLKAVFRKICSSESTGIIEYGIKFST